MAPGAAGRARLSVALLVAFDAYLRVSELVGLRVTSLKRVRIGKVMLGDLPDGKWRFLRPDESF